MDKYSCRCIVPGCEECFEVEAVSRKKAVNKLVISSEEHNLNYHPELPIITVEKIRSLLGKSLSLICVEFVYLAGFVS